MAKIIVKKHYRDGVIVEEHEREIAKSSKMSLTEKLTEKQRKNKQKQKLNSLLFGGKK